VRHAATNPVCTGPRGKGRRIVAAESRYRIRRSAARFLLFMLSLIPLSLPSAAHAQDEVLERAVKATFLYKFVPFVEWPQNAFASDDAPVEICVIGPDPFGEILDEAVADQTIAGRPVEVQRLDSEFAPADCHVAFVSGAVANGVLENFSGRPVLTVTDSAEGAEATGIIHFVVEGERVRFDIDAAEANEHGLSISARLLALARMVHDR